MSNNSNASADVVFEYTGKGCVVPKNVTTVRFHPSVVEVEIRAFNCCKQLWKVVFNVGLQKIGGFAFLGCRSLSSITLTSNVTEIGIAAFSGCINLREVLFHEGLLQKIGNSAFCGCLLLSSITLPSTVAEIGKYAFADCNSLREVVFHGAPRKVGAYAFSTTVTFPTLLGEYAFQSCTSLSSITLPSTVTEVGAGAFSYCSNLREVVFHGVPREIGQYAFINCTSLERFTFPTISSRLDTIIQTGHWEVIEDEVDEVRGVVERSRGELSVSAQAMGGGNNWNRVRDDLDKIVRLISYYELKEGTSLFELALWKFKLDQVDKANPIPRKKCRMDVPGPVKDIILQYLPCECLLPIPTIQSL